MKQRMHQTIITGVVGTFSFTVTTPLDLWERNCLVKN